MASWRPLIFLKTLGNSHSNVARLYNNIAVAWEKKCEYVKALAYYEKSLAIDLITLGETHSSISNLYKKIGKCGKNESLYFELNHESIFTRITCTI